MTRRAVVVTGARWWGDPSLDPSGASVKSTKADVRAVHLARARAERTGAHKAIAELPEGVIVIHTGEHGATRAFAEAASLAELEMMTVPREVLVEVVGALKSSGWTMKALVAGPDPEVVEKLRSLHVFIAEVQPWVEPDPEPETEPDGVDDIGLPDDQNFDEHDHPDGAPA